MSWLLNELSPINVDFGAEVYKFISNETPTDTNKISNLLASVRRNEGGGGWCVSANVAVRREALGGEARDDIE